MSRLALAAAVGVLVWSAARLVVPVRSVVAARIRPYSQQARARLGAPVDPDALRPVVSPGGAVVAVLLPMWSRAGAALTRLFDASPEAVERLVQQADWGTGPLPLRVDRYRREQLAWTTGGAASGVVLAMAQQRGPGVALLFGVGLGYCAAVYHRRRLRRAVEERAARMQVETYTMAQLLSVHLRTGRGGVPEAVRWVASRGRGPIAGELATAAGLNRDPNLGAHNPARLPLHDALEAQAKVTADPAAARLYRLLAKSQEVGTDIVPGLLALGDELSRSRREMVRRTATVRRNAMVVPLLVLMAPVMILEIALVIPSLIRGVQ